VSEPREWPLPLTEAQLDEIAEKAAERAVEKVFARIYQEVGKGVVRKALYVIGMAVVVLAAWLAGAGHLKP
jgi:tetrahydromethanopterin S-methyltransferase subunit G